MPLSEFVSGIPSTFVSCEDALPPVLGVFNFYASLTSVPIMLVPLLPLKHSIASSRWPPLLAWLVALTVTFLANLHLHVRGPTNTGTALGNQLVFGVQLQGVLSAHMINALRLRSGLTAAPPKAALFACATGAALVLGVFLWPAWQEPVTAAVDLLLSPYIVWTMGYMSRGDAYAWPLFLRACAGLILSPSLVAVEPRACEIATIAPFYHAALDHAAICLLFSSVAWLHAVHLAERPAAPRDAPSAIKRVE